MVTSKDTLPTFADDRGTLGVAEFESLPFIPQRFFWLSAVEAGANRAGHGHKSCHQFLVCLSGELTAVVTNSDGLVISHRMKLGACLHLRPRHWLDLVDFTSDAVLGVFANQPYDYSEYITSKADL